RWRSCFLVVFFSSRRRHTRSKRDWSSDVCSSDLPILIFERRNTYLLFHLIQIDVPSFGQRTIKWYLFLPLIQLEVLCNEVHPDHRYHQIIHVVQLVKLHFRSCLSSFLNVIISFSLYHIFY